MYVLITRDQCKYCTAAKGLLSGAGKNFTTYNVQSDSSKWVLTLIKAAGYKTVPLVFAPDGSYIGGYTELKEHLND